jgi:coenzyme F420-dependent glucose-6-phosphate dehydrogenase
MKIGFHASHEQFTPRYLLELVQQAEKAGFTEVLSSDHFHPWSDKQGESGFAWSWLGAAMQATNLSFGIVNAPGQRYHPAIIAQAAATLDQMFPGRFWLCQGSGQALNENITGDKWPPKDLRNERLKESVDIIRELWKGEYVTHHGIIKVENAKLFTPPVEKIPVYGAAITPKTAGWLAEWADGMITISKPEDELKKVTEAFKNGGGDGKSMVIKVQISYAATEEKATLGAWEQWRNNIFPSKLLADINTADKFDDLGDKVRKQDLKEHVIISNDPQKFIDKINTYRDLGFEKIIIHNVNKDQEDYIDFFGNEVLSKV